MTASGKSVDPDAADAALDPLLFDDRLTAAGLVIETHGGFREVIDADLASLGVSGSAFEVLLRLARSPGQRLRMSELAAQSTLTNSGLTRVVDRLQSARLVAREPCRTDRRGFFAVLTPAGLDRVVQILPRHLETVDRVLISVLAPEELEVFLQALRKVRAAVRPGSDPVVAARVADGEPLELP